MLWYTIAMELTDSIAAKHRFARFAAMANTWRNILLDCFRAVAVVVNKASLPTFFSKNLLERIWPFQKMNSNSF